MNRLEALALMHVRVLPRRLDRSNAGDWADVLANVRLFKGASNRRLRKLAREATFAELAPGEMISSPVDHGNYLYIILSGTVEAFSRPAPRTLRAGDYFGELGLIDGRPRSGTVIARGAVHVMKLPTGAVQKFAREHSTFSLAVIRDLAPRLRRLEAGSAG